jgi:preprotein translocase subunit SecA
MKTPEWVRRVLGLPGAASFARQSTVVDAALERREALQGLTAEQLRERAQTTASDSPHAEVLALAGEATQRGLGTEPFREQYLAAAAMLDGSAVEMDTGEGKTLAGALAAAAFALLGRSVHVISVNDYLAARDAEWMGPLYSALGISSAAVAQPHTSKERRAAYRAQVTYVSVSEVGYDVLRDRFRLSPTERVAPARDVAIVDEADAVMIDEAMVPLVLAGTTPASGDDTAEAAELVTGLEAGTHYEVDHDGATVSFTDAGLDLLEARLGGVNLFADENIPTFTRLNLALHADVLMRRDVDYVVEDGRLRLVNTSRGRIAPGQRWPDGLHAAVEAKEGITASGAGIILDSLTVQDLLLGYDLLTGMSGTVIAVAEELTEFYSLRSGRVERRLPLRRTDEDDVVLATPEAAAAAAVDEVERRHRTGQPILVGTQSIAESERMADLLGGRGIEARVLNAKNDRDEAHTVARAGELGALTISTQMSGRGTDIVLGGVDAAAHDAVAARGGLAVIQVGMYPSRRLDAQLRGRAGRQGDPGSAIRFSSVTDELVLNNATRTIREQVEDPSRLDDARRHVITETAQRISEAIRADLHRSTWGYTRAIRRQRDTVLFERERLMASDDAARERIGDLGGHSPDAAAIDGIREVLLMHLDDQWTEHLGLLQATRDGIHLRALGGQNPLDEFHTIALKEFDGFFDRAYAAAGEALRQDGDLDIQAALDAGRARRPSATWTYMVTDNPLGDASSRAAEALRAMWKGRSRR